MASLAIQVALWTTLGLGFGYAAERLYARAQGSATVDEDLATPVGR
jgi:hypothetical protein